MSRKHAFVVAGTQSGCGKTTLTLALLAAYKARGLKVQPFKVGPDFIDPGFHTRMAGLESRNLDGWMLTRDYNLTLFHDCLSRADLGVVEGVMGLFDGYDGKTESGSTAEMAKWLGIPVVLVVDARSMARSAAALIYGFSRFDPDLQLAGVIFNRVGGPGHLEYLREAMSANLPEIPVLGGIPRDEFIRMPERHLGLVTADESPLDPQHKDKLIDLVERYVDLDLLLERAECFHEQTPGQGGRGDAPWKKESSRIVSPSPLIAVARDAAFCFYYPDNFELLERAGAGLHFFSPLAGETFPEETSGLYLGGGYPELFAENISGQKVFLESVRKRAAQGMPIYAECGGLMVLGRFIVTLEGDKYPMAGILPFGTRMLNRRKALGYTEVVLRESCLLGEAGSILRGHEFHYSEIVDDGVGSTAELHRVYDLHHRKYAEVRQEGYRVGSILASYIHLHWGSAPGAPAAFVKYCREFQTDD
ncbi:cobyrinate a,c-diamide synthase [Desulforhabdus amnigena]|uniref:Cobyrinate a,c-diamide synthase n=1 Tax=Desulforhabdus amnigena TaxID=40218 RepID=A0A9W6D3U2_9BACT|nr:cobyrinate a,c-diamide synthase [Desulforhabdus amnigena]NLJ27206.1 cobyrinate a,c-diamide synthase [Deltaproteobacteria bacterium]GLI34058.1 cobyrinate a,c-diamide synthase [Desulforhabdus amnigena]